MRYTVRDACTRNPDILRDNGIEYRRPQNLHNLGMQNIPGWVIILHFSYLMLISNLSFALNESDLVETLTYNLAENGFENVAVISEDGRVIVGYENRIYRYEIRAIKEVMAILSPIVEGNANIILIPENRRIPMVAIIIPANQYRSFLSGNISSEKLASTIDVSLEVDSLWQKIKAVPKANTSAYKFDMVVHPQFKAQLGNYDDPVKTQINLAPEINTALWQGMSLSAQLIIPLQNELSEEGDRWRPGLVTINQSFRLPYHTLVSTTLGCFTQHRYGVDLEIRRYFANGRWSVGANIGYTGYASYRKRGWYYSDVDLLTAFFNVEYRFAHLGLNLRATYGRFLYQDQGWRFDILRQFGEVDIGFFVLKTQTGRNVGFNLSIPILPPKYLPTGLVRIRPAEAFLWEYRAKGLPNDGIRYKTGNSIDLFMKRLNPDYIKNQIAEFEDW